MIDSARWCAAAASVIGRQHESGGGRCEDAWAIARHRITPQKGVLALCVSDGAGSAKNGWVGARVTSRYLAHWLGANYVELRRRPSRAASWAATSLRRTLRRAARAKGDPLKSFACTLVALVIADDDTWIAFHVGDGAVAGRVNGVWIPLSVPKKGEFANVTYFVTDDDAAESMHVIRSDADVLNHKPTAFALFTDGVEGALMNRQTGEIAPALDYVCDWLRVHTEQEVAAALERQLQAVFCARTGDDCSLAVLSRLSIESHSSCAMPNVDSAQQNARPDTPQRPDVCSLSNKRS